MRLLDYMKRNGIGDGAMAAAIGDDVTPRAVKKWKYGEATPPLVRLLKIEEVTHGEVAPADFMKRDGAVDQVSA